jgi:hypothetical protein
MTAPVPLGNLLLNGDPYSWNDLHVYFREYPITRGRLTSLTWSREIEVTEIRDGDNVPIATTEGSYKASASFEMVADEFRRIVLLVGFGVQFDATVQYAPKLIGKPPLVWTLEGCKIIKEENSTAVGAEYAKTAGGLWVNRVVIGNTILSPSLGGPGF